MVSCYGRRQRVKNWILLKWRAGKNTSASRPVILLVFVCSNGNRFFWSILCYFCSSVLLLTWPLRGQHSFWKWLNVASDRIATTSPQKNTSNQNCWFLVNLWRICFFWATIFFLGGNQKRSTFIISTLVVLAGQGLKNLTENWCLRCLRWDFTYFCKGLEICDRCAWKSGMELHCRGLPPNFSVPIRRFLVNKRFWGTWPWHCFFGWVGGGGRVNLTQKREVEQSRKRRKTTKEVNKI